MALFMRLTGYSSVGSAKVSLFLTKQGIEKALAKRDTSDASALDDDSAAFETPRKRKRGKKDQEDVEGLGKKKGGRASKEKVRVKKENEDSGFPDDGQQVDDWA